MDLRQLGSRIRKQHEKRGLRQADIAGALQISAQAVSKWERSENAPDISILVELSRLLGVSVEWLLGGTEAEAETFPATVFCTSLKGFARKSATMNPREVAAWANGIYYTVTEALLRYDGVPVKYVGDGFLGFFAGANQAERALKAARQARESLNIPELVVTLHKGEIFLGTIGHPDYASPDILGQAVNTAFLAMPWVTQNCPGGIGVSESAAQAIGENASLKLAGNVAIDGIESPINIYEPQLN